MIRWKISWNAKHCIKLDNSKWISNRLPKALGSNFPPEGNNWLLVHLYYHGIQTTQTKAVYYDAWIIWVTFYIDVLFRLQVTGSTRCEKFLFLTPYSMIEVASLVLVPNNALAHRFHESNVSLIEFTLAQYFTKRHACHLTRKYFANDELPDVFVV